MWVPLILVGIVLGIVLLRKYNIKMPAIAVNMPQVSGQTIAWVLGGIVLLVAVIVLYSTKVLSGIEPSKINLWIGIGILVALAASGIMKKGGIAGTVALVVVVGGLLLFGADAPEVWKKVQNGVSSVVLSGSKSVTAEPSLGSNALPAAMTKVVTWSTYNQDGSVPVGVRSEEFELHDKCTLNNYPMGYGHIYVLWYYDEKSSAGWIVQKYDTGIVGANRKFAVEVLVPRVKKEEMKFLEVCPYTLPKE